MQARKLNFVAVVRVQEGEYEERGFEKWGMETGTAKAWEKREQGGEGKSRAA
jgi:hypothetical protein